MKYLQRATLLSSLLLLPVGLALAQNSSWFDYATTNLLTVVLPTLVKLLIAIALLYFFWGLVVFITQSGNEQARAEGRQKMIWGIIALFVIVSVWGLVQLLQEIVGATGGTTPTAPQVTYTP